MSISIISAPLSINVSISIISAPLSHILVLSLLIYLRVSHMQALNKLASLAPGVSFYATGKWRHVGITGLNVRCNVSVLDHKDEVCCSFANMRTVAYAACTTCSILFI